MTAKLSKAEKAVLCWLATVDAKNRPNVTPKEIFAEIADGSLVIADIASARSVQNIRTNPAVCLSLIDISFSEGGSWRVQPRSFLPIIRTSRSWLRHCLE
jgi:predicted pyridoxine 5'-phosphate oxidase superfamily flavin-nucleotide-binding protein